MTMPAKTLDRTAADDSISAYGPARSTIKGTPLNPDELRKIDAYWRASLYLSLGMLYLKENPLLREPLKVEHTKPRLLGHWGSDAGQSFTYIHFNRLINKYDLNAIFISGPGHGAPAVLSNAYLEGTYSEVYPDKSRRRGGDAALLQAVQLSGRHRQPCHSRDARQHPRGWRVGLQRLACVRNGLRQPRPHHAGDGRGRRVRDRAAGHELAQQQVPQPDHRRGGAAGPAPQRVQDQQSNHPRPHQPRGARGAVPSATATPRTSSRAAIRRACTRRWRPLWSIAFWRSARSRKKRGGRARPSGRAGRWSSCAAPRAGPPRDRWTGTTWRVSGGRTRSRSQTSPPIPAT